MITKRTVAVELRFFDEGRLELLGGGSYEGGLPEPEIDHKLSFSIARLALDEDGPLNPIPSEGRFKGSLQISIHGNSQGYRTLGAYLLSLAELEIYDADFHTHAYDVRSEDGKTLLEFILNKSDVPLASQRSNAPDPPPQSPERPPATKTELLAMTSDASDRAVAEKHLACDATSNEEMLRSLVAKLQKGVRAGIARIFVYFGTGGFAALCDALIRDVFTPRQVQASLGRFEPTEERLELAFSTAQRQPDQLFELYRLVLRWAGTLLTTSTGQKVMEWAIGCDDPRIWRLCLSALSDEFRADDADRAANARSLFVKFHARIAEDERCTDEIRKQMLMSSIDFDDGQFVDYILGEIENRERSYGVRSMAIIKYLDVFGVKNSRMLLELSRHQMLMEILQECWRCADSQVRSETIGTMVIRGLRALPFVKEWIAETLASGDPVVIHELFDLQRLGYLRDLAPLE